MMRIKCNKCGCICYAGETGIELWTPEEDGEPWEVVEHCPECGSTDIMDFGDPDEDVDAIVAGIYGERAEDLDELGKEIAD